jgi:hypothetical protein
VYEDRFHAHLLHEDEVLNDGLAHAFIDHGRTAVFDDDDFAAESAKVRQCFYQHIRIELIIHIHAP